MKTTIAHSPGPWRLGVRQPTSDKFIYGSRGEEIADCDRKTNFADENLANARLIAAAPELLAALREAEAWTAGDVDAWQYLDADTINARLATLRAAIAKATA